MKREIWLVIVLSIITCGFYNLYWIVVANDDINKFSNNENELSGGMVLLLTIVTCGLYGFYWLYVMSDRIDKARAIYNLPSKGNLAILYILLAIFGFGIVSYALIQDEINHIVDANQNNNETVYINN